MNTPAFFAIDNIKQGLNIYDFEKALAKEVNDLLIYLGQSKNDEKFPENIHFPKFWLKSSL